MSSSSSEQALRDVSDRLLNDLETLSQLEERKRHMKPDDPDAREIARQVAVIAARVLSRSMTEEQITRDAHAAATKGVEGAPSRSISETPRSIHTVLEDWRAAERRVSAADPGSTEHAAATLEAERFRQEYQRQFDERQQAPEG